MNNKEDLIKFSTTQLSKLLGLPQQDAKDVTNYILSFQTEAEVLKYLNDFVGANSPFTSQFLAHARKLSLFKSEPSDQPPALSRNQQRKQLEAQQKEKERLEQEARMALPAQATVIEKSDLVDDFYKAQGTGKGKKKGPEKAAREYEEFFDPDAKKKAYLQPILIKKKKNNSADPQSQAARQRMQCGCQGTLHPFVNNCLHCGRIACEIEDEGLCYGCNEYFITYHESVEGVETPLNGLPRMRESIVANKSMIYDDQADYYNFNDTWLTGQEKEAMRKKEEEKRKAEENKSKKFTIDFGGRMILAEGNSDNFAKEVQSGLVEQSKDQSSSYMTSDAYRKRQMQYTTKTDNDSGPLSITKKKREALGLGWGGLGGGNSRLQSQFYPDEDFDGGQAPDTTKNQSQNSQTVNNDEDKYSKIADPVKVPPGLTYKRSYITKKEEAELMKQIDNMKWDTDLSRRTQQYEYKYDYQAAYGEKKKGGSRLSPTQKSPPWLANLCKRLHDDGCFGNKVPNQIIINEYMPGQGIAPHLDHKGSFGEIVVSLSLMSGVIMDFQNNETKETISIFLHPCSLVILSLDSRYHWTHGIKGAVVDNIDGCELFRRRRVSITFRSILEHNKNNHK